MAFAETQKLTIQLDLKGNVKSAVAGIARDLQGLDKHTSNTQRSLGKLSQNLQRGIAVGAAAAVGGFVAVAKAAGDFEAQLHTINTVATLSKTDLAAVGDALRKIARDTGLSLDDLTSGYYDLVSAGVKGTLAQEALNDAVKLGIGGLATTAESVNLMTTAINAYGLDAAGAAKATDQFALAVADGVIHVDQIAASFSDVASIAKAYGIGIDQIATSYAFLTKQGVAASEVTTEMQRAIVSLINPTKDLEEAQKKLKINFTEEIRKKGLVPALQELRTYSDKTGIPLIALLGRIEAVKYTLQTTGPEFKGYTAELERMGKASGVAAAQMAERQQGLNFQLGRLKALTKDAAITIGSALLPKLTPLIEKLNSFISANQGKIADFGTKLAKGFEDFAAAVQKVDFKGILGGLELTSKVAKTIVDTFLALPPDIQKLAVAALAINKVGGGIITSGIKDIAGLILSRLTTIQAANVTVIGANVAGGLPGVVPGGGGTSLLGKVLKSLPWIAVGAVIAEGFVQGNKEHPETYGTGGANYQGRTVLPRGGARTGGMTESPTTIGGAMDRALVKLGLGPAITKGQQLAELNARRIEAAENRQTVAVTRGLSAVDRTFRNELEGLKKATKANDVAKFAKELAKEIAGGKGSAGSTKDTLATLKGKLAETHDPKLQAVLRHAIAQVQAKLPNREWVQGQLDAAKKIVAGTESEKRKLDQLNAIQRSLRAKGDVHAAKTVAAMAAVGKKVDAAKAKIAGDTRAEGIGIRAAIKAQDLSVKVNVYNNLSITNRSMGKAQTTHKLISGFVES